MLLLSSSSPCFDIKSLYSDILEVILRNICSRIICSSTVGMQWQVYCICLTLLVLIGDAICTRRYITGSAWISVAPCADPYPEKGESGHVTCRGVGLGDRKRSFRPIITYCLRRGMCLNAITLNYHIINAEA